MDHLEGVTMETDFRRRLSGLYYKMVLDALNSDKTIGPFAPGDGDVISWYTMVCWLGVYDLITQVKAGTLQGVDGFQLEADYKFPKAKFPTAMASMGDAIFEAYFQDFEATPVLTDNIRLHQHLIKMEFIHYWGGREVRVPKRRKIRNVRQRVGDALSQRVPVEEIAETIGISRATVYRILAEKN